MTTAISTRASSGPLVSVRVQTLLGDEYQFPAMDKTAIESALPKGENRLPENMPSLSLVNVSSAVLCILFSTIKTVTVGDELWWENPTTL